LPNYKYKAKRLKPLDKQKLLGDFAVFDIETSRWLDDTRLLDEDVIDDYHDKTIDPFLLVYYDGSSLQSFKGQDCVNKFLKNYLTYKNRSKLCFAHNGGKFDVIALYQEYMRDPYFYDNFTYHPVMQGSRIMSFKIRDDSHHQWEFRDSFSLLPRSLDYLCKSFKPDHVKLEMPSTTFLEDPAAWIKYCGNDCISLYEILKTFNETMRNVQGCIGYTIASTALSTYRYRFMPTNFETYHAFNQYFRQAYYGGRTEIFNMHARDSDKPFYYYDINSLYPHVMHDYEYPISRPTKTVYQDISECEGKCGLMLCDVVTPPDLNIPVLPFHRDDGRLIFPLGNWRGLYEYSFVEKALKYGYDVKAVRAWEFDSKPIFKEFTEHFYELKKQSSGAEQEIYKLLLNSLYGKWGERAERKELITDPDVRLEGLLPYDTFFGYAIRKTIQHSAYHLPAISIRVTALAQLKLYELFELAKRHGGTIYYCDTDSLITDVRLPTSNKLGDIKLEHTFQEGVFLMPKVYYLKLFDNDEIKIRIKGFTKNVQPYLRDIDVWKKALYENDYSAFYEDRVRPASLNEIRIRHLQGFVTLVEKKRIKHCYDKRYIEKDFSTRPLIISM